MQAAFASTTTSAAPRPRRDVLRVEGAVVDAEVVEILLGARSDPLERHDVDVRRRVLHVNVPEDERDLLGLRRLQILGEAAASEQVMLRIDAEDQAGGSGVAEMRVSTQADFAQAEWESFAQLAALSAQPGETVYIQVRDAVGNVSTTASVAVPVTTIYLPTVQR